MWPFVEEVSAQSSSRNRPAGTLELNNVTVNLTLYSKFLTEKVVPVIWAKFPRRNRCAYFQQDNAPVHCRSDDPSVIEIVLVQGLYVRLVKQSPNSPDFNELDWGFFRAIQSLQYKKSPRNIRELVDTTKAVFNAFESQKLYDIFLTLHKCIVLSMK